MNKVIVLDPESGGSHKVEYPPKFISSDISFKICQIIKENLSKDIEVILTREKDIAVSDSDRLETIRNSNADFVLSPQSFISQQIGSACGMLISNRHFIDECTAVATYINKIIYNEIRGITYYGVMMPNEIMKEELSVTQRFSEKPYIMFIFGNPHVKEDVNLIKITSYVNKLGVVIANAINELYKEKS